MRTLHASSSSWLSMLPSSLTPLKRTIENIKDPLYRLDKILVLENLIFDKPAYVPSSVPFDPIPNPKIQLGLGLTLKSLGRKYHSVNI